MQKLKINRLCILIIFPRDHRMRWRKLRLFGVKSKTEMVGALSRLP
jgi:hypothetical protein